MFLTAYPFHQISIHRRNIATYSNRWILIQEGRPKKQKKRPNGYPNLLQLLITRSKLKATTNFWALIDNFHLIPVWFSHNDSAKMLLQVPIDEGGIQFGNIVDTYSDNSSKFIISNDWKNKWLKELHEKSMAKFKDNAYLFSQFSSLEVLFSPIIAPADAWTFMIWLAIICKHKSTRVEDY